MSDTTETTAEETPEETPAADAPNDTDETPEETPIEETTEDAPVPLETAEDIVAALADYNPMKPILGESFASGDFYCVMCSCRTKRYEPGMVTDHKDGCVYGAASRMVYGPAD